MTDVRAVIKDDTGTELFTTTNPGKVSTSPATLSSKANVFNTALPGAGSNLLSTGVTTTSAVSYLNVTACMSITGVLSVTRTVSAVTVSGYMNAGTALVAGAEYAFTLEIRTGETINFNYSTTGGNTNYLRVTEAI